MNIQRHFMIACLCLIGVDAAFAQQSQPVDGAIHFHGRIIESSCMAGRASYSFLDLLECPRANTRQVVNVRNVSRINAEASNPQGKVTAQLVTDTRKQEQYYAQRYVLRDAAGKQINSGNYLVTLTLP
ncbi:type 1 fimbrial protein [Pseudomonas sp. A34-9]|uniref:type 1 fimbrial protein n=1 Tax=Pseudomonas sp. A34-9 TaxID=3034675 RepID=UPI00240D31E0|nr:type 1 fimbrial protein [Pseudomonas sp. A34-9]